MAKKAPKKTLKERRKDKMVAFARAMATFPTIPDAAEHAGISTRTSTRWLHSAEFKACLDETRGQHIQAVQQQAMAMMVRVLQIAVKILNDAKAAPTARINAGKLIQEVAFKGDQVLVREMMTQVEEQMGIAE